MAFLAKMSSIYQMKGLDELYLTVPKRHIRNQPILNKTTKQQRPYSEVGIGVGAKRAYVPFTPMA